MGPHARTSLRRLWLAAFLLTAFLTVQLAAAAYACAGSRYAVSTDRDMTGMTGMIGMTESCPDMAQKAVEPDSHDGLCLEHCQLGSKSLDHASPQLPVFHASLVHPVMLVLEPLLARPNAAAAGATPRGPPRPLSILHCCFRT